MDYKGAKKNWIKLFRGTYKNIEYNFLDPVSFITKYASKIRWAKSILEIGMGNGELLNYLVDRYPNKEYSGIDLNPEVLHEHQGIIKKCTLNIGETGKYLKNMEGIVDAIISHCHLMYFPDSSIEKICHLISQKADKYILIKEILTSKEYNDKDYISYFKYGFGRDYSEMFEDFILKENEVEIVDGIEYQSYLFKKI